MDSAKPPKSTRLTPKAHAIGRDRPRPGSFIIEAVISAALMATALFALTQLARNSSALSQQADQRLAATLAAENTLESLAGVPIDQINQNAKRISDRISEASGYQVVVKSEELPDQRGVHLQVTASFGESVQVTMHDWRLSSADAYSAGDVPQQPSANDDAAVEEAEASDDNQ